MPLSRVPALWPTTSPIEGRSFCVSAAMIVLLLAGPAAADSLSEEQIIRLARNHHPEAAQARSAVKEAEAERTSARMRANPSVDWDRESLPGSGGRSEREDSLRFSVPIDLSSGRTMRDHLAKATVAGAQATSMRARSRAVVDALHLYYRLLAEQRRAEIEKGAADSMSEANRIISRRKQEASVSGYEQVRIEIEAELAASALRQTRARTQQLHAELALLLGQDPAKVTFAGDLAANAVHANAEQRSKVAGQRRSQMLLRKAEGEARRAEQAAGWAWLPSVELSVGPRVTVTDETRYGYVAGVSVQIPIFSRGQDLRARAEAGLQRSRAQADALQRKSLVEIRRAELALASAHDEAQRFDEFTRTRVGRLMRAAESGYREGERSIIEFVDASRSRTTVELRQLELMTLVKLSEVAVRASRGEFE